MNKIRNKKWNVIVPIVDQGWACPGRVTEYRAVSSINAPTYERAIEEAAAIAKPYVDKYLNECHDNVDKEESKSKRYLLRGKSLWRVQEMSMSKGTLVDKYI